MDDLGGLLLALPLVSHDPTEPKLLADSLRARFELLGDPVDLDDAIEYQARAVSLASDTHTDMPALLNGLGILLGHRFARSGNLVDIEKAIEHQRRALSLVPDGHPETAGIMNQLGLSLRRRYGRLGNPDDIDKAIEHQKNAAAIATEDAEMGNILNHLGNSFGLRFERIGNPEDIEKAIEYQTRCISLTPQNDEERPKFLNNLGNSFWRRFKHLGSLEDLNHAIDYREQAVLLLPEGHPEKHRFLNNLGVAFLGRFERHGRLDDLDQAIRHLEEVIRLRPANHADRSGPLNNLGICFWRRFERTGSLFDVDRAIKYQQEAIQLTPDSHARKPVYLINIGQTLLTRNYRLGDRVDLERAIEGLQQAEYLLPTGHTEKPRALQCLGDVYLRRFTLLGNKLDLDEAISCHKLSTELFPTGHSLSLYLCSLGHSFFVRYDRFGDSADFDQAVKCNRTALSSMPDDSTYVPKALAIMAAAFQLRFDRFSNPPDIDESIKYSQRALSLLPEFHPLLASLLARTGCAFESRFQSQGERSDLIRAIDYFQQAARAERSPAFHRFDAARRWIRLLAEQPDGPVLEAYQLAMNLLDWIMWQGNTIKRRYMAATYLGDFVTEATAAAVASKEYARALEWFEQGRSIVWRQRLQLRQPVDALYPANHYLASRFEIVMRELDAIGTAEPGVIGLDQVVGSEETAQRHRRLAEELAGLTDLARGVPGFEDFLKPKTFSQLAAAARYGPVVVVNVHKNRCDALALLVYGETVHIPIPSYSYDKATRAYTEWMGNLKLYNMRERGVKKHNDPNKPSRAIFVRVLTELWMDVVRPILDSLGLLRIHPNKPLPRLTWCATGPLAFLPIHAAGCYNPTQPKQRIFDYVISSYTPTLSSLLVPSKSPNQFRGILAVGQKTTPGKSDLPHALEEVERVQNAARNLPFQRLAGADATVGAVLKGIEEYSWVHFACHAIQDAGDPNESAFFLQDGKLNLATITKRHLKHASLAYLSACQTAAGHKELPEEAIHLAAGMLMAGFGTVIGTMWSMKDEHGPLVAERFYDELTKDGIPDSRRSVEALHKAVAHLRDLVGEEKYEDWAPFIHVGV
ncbi:hypothetical protein FRC06_004337 [Ceratobasidium sp. 370]|nr:hypothetical protein FRC06_004337 [Ceratobasidium sp. 370]